MHMQATREADVVQAAPIPSSTWIPRVANISNRLMVPFALLAVAVALTMMIGLHLLPGWGGVNPLTGMLSDYGIRPDGWVFDTALDIMSIGSVAVLVQMARHGVVRNRAGFALMVSWCVCLVGIATFTKDPTSGTQTVTGTVHLWVTATACASLPFAGLAIGWQHRKDPAWRRFALATQALAGLSVPCFLPFVVSFFVIRLTHATGPSALPTGLVERLMGLVDVAIIVVLAIWSHRAYVARKRLAATGRPA